MRRPASFFSFVSQRFWFPLGIAMVLAASFPGAGCQYRPVRVCGLYSNSFHLYDLERIYLAAEDIVAVDVLENLDAARPEDAVITPNISRSEGKSIHALVRVKQVYKGAADGQEEQVLRMSHGWSLAHSLDVSQDAVIYVLPPEENTGTTTLRLWDETENPKVAAEAVFRLEVLQTLTEEEIGELIDWRQRLMRRRHFPRMTFGETIDWVDEQIASWYRERALAAGLEAPDYLPVPQ